MVIYLDSLLLNASIAKGYLNMILIVKTGVRHLPV